MLSTSADQEIQLGIEDRLKRTSLNSRKGVFIFYPYWDICSPLLVLEFSATVFDSLDSLFSITSFDRLISLDSGVLQLSRCPFLFCIPWLIIAFKSSLCTRFIASLWVYSVCRLVNHWALWGKIPLQIYFGGFFLRSVDELFEFLEHGGATFGVKLC